MVHTLFSPACRGTAHSREADPCYLREKINPQVPWSHCIVRIPSIAQKRPTQDELDLLARLPADGADISGRLLRKRLREANFFEGSTPENPTKGRETGQLATVLRRPLQWHAAEQHKSGQRNVYLLGPVGPCILDMFPAAEMGLSKSASHDGRRK